MRRQWQQRSGHVERARPQRTTVGRLTHIGRPWHGLDQVLQQRRAQALVGTEQTFGGLTERALGRRTSDLGRQVPARLAEGLVTGAALLAVPHGFVDNRDGRQDRDLLEPEHEVSEVGDRAVPVLKIEGGKELLGLLRAQLLDRLEHALARARVLRQSVGLYLGRYSDD